MQSKKGIELSINFLVIILISLVLLALGTKFTYDIVKGVIKYQDAEEQRILKLLESELCKDDDLVCVPSFNQEISTKKAAFFGVKITNTGSTATFTLDLSYSPNCFIHEDKTTETNCGNHLKIMPQTHTLTIGEKDTFSQLILLERDINTHGPGTYILNLQVLKDGQPFDNKIHKLHVEVN